jgi:hypothetical protein
LHYCFRSSWGRKRPLGTLLIFIHPKSTFAPFLAPPLLHVVCKKPSLLVLEPKGRGAAARTKARIYAMRSSRLQLLRCVSQLPPLPISRDSADPLQRNVLPKARDPTPFLSFISPRGGKREFSYPTADDESYQRNPGDRWRWTHLRI